MDPITRDGIVVRVGQTWRDCDRRVKRTVTVIAVDAERGQAKVVSSLSGTSRLAVRRMHHGSTGFVLMSCGDASMEQARERLLAAGFKRKTYDGQDGEFIARTFRLGELPLFEDLVKEHEMNPDAHAVIELCPDGLLQVCVDDLDAPWTALWIDSVKGAALLEGVTGRGSTP